MTDRFRIDSHKLMFHIRRVNRWLDGELIYPIYMEISPCGACNHRCSFCSVDFMGYQKRFLETYLLKERITEFRTLGLKSIMFAGEGEPFLHKDMPELITHTRKQGIDVAVTTNGVLMYPDVTEKIIDSMTWVKVSLNAGTSDTYAKIHRTSPDDFNKVLKNLEFAVTLKEKRKSACTIGLQILLLPENEAEVETLARISRDIGVDYLVVKPYTRHYKNTHGYDIKYGEFRYLAEEFNAYNSKTFSVVFRTNAMKQWDSQVHASSLCICLPFWSYVDAGGNVWGCSAHLTESSFYYGSITKETFKAIWEGERRKKSLKWVAENLDMKSCKMNCRMVHVNNYLNELINPSAHVNFI